ncbi:MAG: hypothetical protein J7M40_09645 [Planctomycetes bacterium]|nr:hypothetical protein [Planctomycetota bacterium]
MRSLKGKKTQIPLVVVDATTCRLCFTNTAGDGPGVHAAMLSAAIHRRL